MLLNPLVEKIRIEIALQGAIPFARFMELALYCPDYGFYEKESDTVGRSGHFRTSVSVGSLFGELMAFQFVQWVEESQAQNQSSDDEPPASGTLQIVEAGAHDGKLAADILGWIQAKRPQQFATLQYYIVEPSPRRREWQQTKLAAFSSRVCWCDSLGDQRLAAQSSRSYRIVFGNELLDAMPVQRLGWDAKCRRWFEWGVNVAGEGFDWVRLPLSGVISVPSSVVPGELLELLPDDFTIEICPAAEAWWGEAARIVIQGRLLTLDYGLTNEEFFAPHRPSGTLRGYNRHRYADNVLVSPGELDITSHVNFSAILRAGELSGLRTEQFISQTQFLTGIAARTWPDIKLFGAWTPAMTRQFQTLTHPDHFGRAFKVLVQSK